MRVREGTTYPPNHHIFGVGYYHTHTRRWWPLPWNEHRDGRGYYWDGEWHEEPDRRAWLPTEPTRSEAARVNELFLKSDAVLVEDFWQAAQRRGLGKAINRYAAPSNSSRGKPSNLNVIDR